MGNLVELLNGLVAQINELQGKLQDSQKAAEELAKAEFDRGFGEGEISGDAKGYARGFEEGKASVECPIPEPVPVPNPDLKYTQEDLDNAVKNAVEPLQMRISELEMMVAEIPGKIEQAKNELKAEIRAKYEEAQGRENEAEVSFGDFLK